jgi:enamidase
VVSHINGGPTAVSLDEAKLIIEKTDAVEIVQCGNCLRAVQVADIIAAAAKRAG